MARLTYLMPPTADEGREDNAEDGNRGKWSCPTTIVGVGAIIKLIRFNVQGRVVFVQAGEVARAPGPAQMYRDATAIGTIVERFAGRPCNEDLLDWVWAFVEAADTPGSVSSVAPIAPLDVGLAPISSPDETRPAVCGRRLRETLFATVSSNACDSKRVPASPPMAADCSGVAPRTTVEARLARIPTKAAERVRMTAVATGTANAAFLASSCARRVAAVASVAGNRQGNPTVSAVERPIASGPANCDRVSASSPVSAVCMATVRVESSAALASMRSGIASVSSIRGAIPTMPADGDGRGAICAIAGLECARTTLTHDGFSAFADNRGTGKADTFCNCLSVSAVAADSHHMAFRHEWP